jgi:hypothetical protein
VLSSDSFYFPVNCEGITFSNEHPARQFGFKISTFHNRYSLNSMLYKPGKSYKPNYMIGDLAMKNINT